MSSASTIFPVSGVEHGKRIITSVIEQRAKNKDNVWVSLPVDETDLSLGFKDITFWQFNNAANHAANWLNQNLPASKPFECFAYAGPKDLRYPILAVAAAKVQKVVSVYILQFRLVDDIHTDYSLRWYFLRHWSLQQPSQRSLRLKAALFTSDLRKWLSRWLES